MKKSKEASNSLVLPDEGYVRLSTILKVFPIGRSTWYQGVQSGKYPKPVKLGERTSAWRVSDIKELIASYDKQ